MAHPALRDNEQGLPRRTRRAILSNRRCLIKKRTPFGRVKVLDFEVAEEAAETHQDNRVIYKHFTRGLVDRRTTFPLLTQLVG